MFIFICLFTAAPGLRWCTLTFSSGGEWGLLFVVVHRFSSRGGFSCCRPQALGVRGLQQLQHAGSAAEAHRLQGSGLLLHSSITCGIFLDGDQTCLPCMGRWILYQLHHQGSLK